MEHHSFTWFDLIPGWSSLHIPWWITMTVFVCMILIFLSVCASTAARFTEVKLLPDKGVSFRNFVEILVSSLLSFVESILGHQARKYLSLVGGLFLFIFVSNLLGLIPGFLPPTSHLTVNFGCALVVFFYYNYCGFKENGMGYLKHFMGPVIWLAPLMIVVEVIGHAVRPASLSLRLFGNINGDHMLVSTISQLVPIGASIPFLFLGLFVSFLQAFIFTLLSMVYISMSTAHDH
ncbi:MAG: F0F1 ATP synthase subunit A [Deltaproteobacteria bacterium]|nr:F0F1 ATP synthase subunit A [Deltaproteobacteria bacterium]